MASEAGLLAGWRWQGPNGLPPLRMDRPLGCFERALNTRHERCLMQFGDGRGRHLDGEASCSFGSAQAAGATRGACHSQSCIVPSRPEICHDTIHT